MITTDLPAPIPLFATLSEGDREDIAARSADVRLRAGEWLVHEGEVPSFVVLLEGSLDVPKLLGGTETSVPGIFAAGDVRHGSVKRVASGVGEGSMAIAFIRQILATLETPAK
jgi:thioredoxin reductase (NADPH)